MLGGWPGWTDESLDASHPATGWRSRSSAERGDSSAFPLAIQKEREYERFSDMAQDVVDVRIYQGIHFRTADEVGRKQGQRVADWVFENFLQSVDDDDDDDDGGH